MPENGQKIVAPPWRAIHFHLLSLTLSKLLIHPFLLSLSSQDKLSCHVLPRTDAVHISFAAVEAVVTRRNEGGEIDDNHPESGWIVFFICISLEDYRVLSDEFFPSVRPSSPCSRELSFGVLCLLCCAKTKADVSVQRETGPARSFVCGAEIGIALQRQSACRFLKQTEVLFFSIVFFF